MLNQRSGERSKTLSSRKEQKDLRHVVLTTHGGADVSLRRYLRRWLVLRVSADEESRFEVPAFRNGAYWIPVFAREDTNLANLGCGEPSTLFDGTGALTSILPKLFLPATLLLDPDGWLVKIFEGDDRDVAVRHFLSQVPATFSGGAIDLGDISC